MITSLRLIDFKNFADETLKLGPFTVIIGANASGKSNIRDAFRFLHGIATFGRGYTLAEILGGKYGAGGQLEWKGIRGAPREVARLKKQFPDVWSTFDIHVEITQETQKIHYGINVGYHQIHGFSLAREFLFTQAGRIFDTRVSDDPEVIPILVGRNGVEFSQINRKQPALTQYHQHLISGHLKLPNEERAEHELAMVRLIGAFGSIFPIDLVLERMREPGFPGVHMMGQFGQNLPGALKAINEDSSKRNVLLSWLRELTPMDVIDFEFGFDPNEQVYLWMVERNGRKISTYSASDGTLRFLAILCELLGFKSNQFCIIEEIDNGIHPSRLHLLIDLIERETAKNSVQVVATTHSPDVLNLINDTTFENTSVVYRDESSADAIIRPVAELPRVRELRESQGLGRLHAGGWMEDILSFEAADAEAIE